MAVLWPVEGKAAKRIMRDFPRVRVTQPAPSQSPARAREDEKFVATVSAIWVITNGISRRGMEHIFGASRPCVSPSMGQVTLVWLCGVTGKLAHSAWFGKRVHIAYVIGTNIPLAS